MGRPKKVQNTADYSAEMQQETPAAKKANVPDEKVSAIRSEISSLEVSLADTEHLLPEASASEKVLLTKSIERMKSNIDYLKNALENYYSLLAVKSTPAPVPKDYMILATCLDRYTDHKNAEIKKASDMIRKAEEAIAETRKLLEEATAQMDPEGIKKYSALLEDLKKNREYLQPALDKANAADEIPAGKLQEEWSKICEAFLPEWTLQIDRLEAAAREYRAAQNSALELFDLLRVTRSEMQRRGKAAGCPDDITKNTAVFTKVVNGSNAIFFSEKERTALNDAVFKSMNYGERL